MGKLSPYIKKEHWRLRHERRFQDAIKYKSSLKRWCENRELELVVSENNEIWGINPLKIKWIPYTGSLLIDKVEYHVHDVHEIKELIDVECFNKIKESNKHPLFIDCDKFNIKYNRYKKRITFEDHASHLAWIKENGLVIKNKQKSKYAISCKTLNELRYVVLKFFSVKKTVYQLLYESELGFCVMCNNAFTDKRLHQCNVPTINRYFPSLGEVKEKNPNIIWKELCNCCARHFVRERSYLLIAESRYK